MEQPTVVEQAAKTSIPCNFLERAQLLTSRGIPVVPVRPRDKMPCIPEWQNHATTDLATLKAWNEQNPNFNTGAFFARKGKCALDIDAPEIAQKLCYAGIDLDSLRTLKVSSGKPYPCGHNYFTATDRSDALGNVSLKLVNEKGEAIQTLYDFQAHHKICVGPGSVHPSGTIYKIVEDLPLLPIPDALVEWMEDNHGQVVARTAYDPTSTAYDPSINNNNNHKTLLTPNCRPGTLAERVETVLRQVAEEKLDRRVDDKHAPEYQRIKAIIAEQGYINHRHEFDNALAIYLWEKYNHREKVLADFARLCLHQNKGRSYYEGTINKADFQRANNGGFQPDLLEAWPQPEALTPSLLSVAELDVNLLPACFRTFVSDVAERMQVRPDMPCAALLAATFGCIGRRALVYPKRLDNWNEPLNAWGAVVARPGELKTPCINAATAPLREIEKRLQAKNEEARKEYIKAKNRYQADMERWKVQYKEARNKMQVPPEQPEEPEEPKKLKTVYAKQSVIIGRIPEKLRTRKTYTAFVPSFFVRMPEKLRSYGATDLYLFLMDGPTATLGNPYRLQSVRIAEMHQNFQTCPFQPDSNETG